MKDDSKPYFFQRLLAFLFDIMLISFVASLFSTPFTDLKKANELRDEYYEVVQNSLNQEENINQYTVDLMNIEYELFHLNGMYTIIKVLLGLAYFVVFQMLNNGQTLGKKLLKIKVISLDGDLSANQMILRSLLSNSLLLDFLSVIFILFAGRNTFFYCIMLFSLLQYVITFISFILILYGKKGMAVHDFLCHTSVIKVS